jgi:predicted kinase
MTKAKLILINGFNASGKTTIAKKYIADHSLAMAIEADALVDNIGDWTNHRDEVRELAFELTKAMIRAYLPSGHDVVLPYIVTSDEEVEQFESIARDCGADFYETVLYNERPDAIARLLERGKWGSETSPRITEADMPIIEEGFRNMEAALEKRPQTKKLLLKGADPDSTYRQLLEQL